MFLFTVFNSPLDHKLLVHVSLECAYVHAQSLQSCPTLVTLWTVARQAFLSMSFSRQDTGVSRQALLQRSLLSAEHVDSCWLADTSYFLPLTLYARPSASPSSRPLSSWPPANQHFFLLFFFFLDSAIEIELELFVNKTTATKLNSGEDKIEDILVLHLERGKDYFLSVSGNYIPSCFGSPIHTLCYMKEPILDLPLETIRELVSYLPQENI